MSHCNYILYNYTIYSICMWHGKYSRSKFKKYVSIYSHNFLLISIDCFHLEYSQNCPALLKTMMTMTGNGERCRSLTLLVSNINYHILIAGSNQIMSAPFHLLSLISSLTGLVKESLILPAMSAKLKTFMACNANLEHLLFYYSWRNWNCFDLKEINWHVQTDTICCRERTL